MTIATAEDDPQDWLTELRRRDPALYRIAVRRILDGHTMLDVAEQMRGVEKALALVMKLLQQRYGRE